MCDFDVFTLSNLFTLFNQHNFILISRFPILIFTFYDEVSSTASEGGINNFFGLIFCAFLKKTLNHKHTLKGDRYFQIMKFVLVTKRKMLFEIVLDENNSYLTSIVRRNFKKQSFLSGVVCGDGMCVLLADSKCCELVQGQFSCLDSF